MKFLGIAVLCAIAAFGYFLYDATKPGFKDTDISEIKRTIKSEFEKRDGIKVSDVVILKETDTKASGYVKLTIAGIGDITRACTATMDQSGKQYIWRCD
ncbi:hypothetical protein [Methylobacterium fujisawaense]|uniref:hypothetical protein n=1 Tax=Methylobacterium fujisawaense TaxID=107400 RepID=UPI002F350AFC